MARGGAEMVIRISGDSEKFRKELNKIEKQSDASVARMQKRAKVASLALAAAAAGGLAAFNEFRKFERDFSNVVTLLDKSSFKTKEFGQGVTDLKGELLDLGRETGQSFDVLNKGLFDLVSAGVPAEKAISALGVSARLAIAGATDTSTAVDGLTSALNAYSLDTENAQEVAEKFFTAQKFGKTTIEELSSGFGQVGATAASLGVSLDEVLASVSATTTAGVQTSQAYTGLKAVFANIIKPTKDAATEAERLGIAFDAKTLREKGLDQFLKDITSSAGFSKDSLGKLFGSVEALNVVTALAGNQSDEFAQILDAQADAAGRAATFNAALGAKSETADQAIARFNSTVQASAIELGEFVEPAVVAFLDEMTETIIETGKGFEALGIVIGGVATIIIESFKSAFDFLRAGFNSVQADIDGFTAFANETAAKLPFIGDERREGFLENAERARQSQRINESESDQALASGLDFFTDQDEQLERLQEFQEQKNQLIAEGLEEEQAIRVAAEEAGIDAGITKDPALQTEEEFEDTLANQEEREKALQEGRNKATEDELKAAKKAAKEREKIEAEKAKRLADLDKKLTDTLISNAESIFDRSTAIGKAIFLFKKAQAIADIAVNTQEAGMLAYASQLIPGDPTSLARAEAARLYTYIKGAAAAAVVGATAIEGISAQQGGVVPGVGSGDRVPALLEPGEIVVPKKFNPLSPTFEETFGGGIGQQEIKVDLMLDENASKILTAQQRENERLGIDK